MAVKFKPKPGKPHIKIINWRNGSGVFFLALSERTTDKTCYECWAYCYRVNPGGYRTPGEAARALHYGSKS